MSHFFNPPKGNSYMRTTTTVKVRMLHCKKCGTEYIEGAKYCTKCGAPIGEWSPPREECFGERREEKDYLRLVSFGIFLLIVGYILITNPWIPSYVQSLFENLVKESLNHHQNNFVTSSPSSSV
ncbi:MAG: zinc ribbon domain-containing protein [Nitrososphaerales archaeon]